MSEIIQLTDTARLRIETDTDARNPREDMDVSTGFAKIEGRGDSRRIDVVAVHPDRFGLADAHDRMDAGRYAYRPTIFAPDGTKGGWVVEKISRTPVDTRVRRWARIYRGVHVEYDSEHGGYWFVDEDAYWGSMTPEQGRRPLSLEEQEKVITGERKTYEAWAESEVYGVILEREVTWARLDENGEQVFLTEPNTLRTWEEVESVWGCYLNDEYTAQTVAVEHFDMTDEEESALESALPVHG